MNKFELIVEWSGGSQAVAEVCGVTRQAVEKWMRRGCLPRTEWTGETAYAGEIAKLTKGKFTKDDLLAIKPGQAA